jgi:hypothetical protein
MLWPGLQPRPRLLRDLQRLDEDDLRLLRLAIESYRLQEFKEWYADQRAKESQAKEISAES